MIGTINTERTHTTPTILNDRIAYHWGRNQFPYIVIDVDNSEVQTDNLPLNSGYDHLPIVHTLLVMGFLKYPNDKIHNYAEDWIEAIIRVLHNYNGGYVSWIFHTNVERADLYKNENETMKSFLVSFEVKIH